MAPAGSRPGPRVKGLTGSGMCPGNVHHLLRQLTSAPSGQLPYRLRGNGAVGQETPATEGMTMRKPITPPRAFTVADAHALADRLERNQRPQSDQAIAVKLIRATQSDVPAA
jgi:hypothetical protein